MIDEVLSSTKYDFVNISLGPPLAVEDDEVHTWTAVLDDRFARTPTLATIAVGNNGQSDATERLNPILVPSDCVNALAIGACDTPGEGWRRASYSAVGPGRQPGFVKPDLLEFGGYGDRVFLTVDQKIRSNTATLIGVMGTSYASPSVLRLAAGIKAHYGNYLSNLAIRGLLIHTSENNDSSVEEIGWGRVARNLAKVVSCSDNAIRVIYQGGISPTKFVRAWLPYINHAIKGMVSITATLCYKTEVDPGHPSNYTRAGLEAVFQPNDKKYSGTADINPKSEPFFGLRKKYSTEMELRRFSYKWENCIHQTKKKRGISLRNPCFDIHYISRLESRDFKPNDNLQYVLVVSIEAEHITDFYERIVTKYHRILEPVRPNIEIPTTV